MKKIIYQVYKVVNQIRIFIRIFYDKWKLYQLMKQPKIVNWSFVPQKGSSNQESKCREWQSRQKQYLNDPVLWNDDIKSYSIFGEQVQKEVLKTILYKKDKNLYNQDEYLATTNEILESKYGDCEDQAYVMLKKLRDEYRIPDKYLVCLFVEDKNGGHVIGGIQFDDNVLLLDNGHYWVMPVWANEFFNRKPDINIICGYNFVDHWIYHKA